MKLMQVAFYLAGEITQVKGVNTLGPLCLWQCFLVGVGGPKGISRNDPILQGSNDLSCSLCKTVMELVDQAITDEANEQAVIF